MATIAELLIKLGMDDGGLDKGMSSSQSKLKSWGESLRSVGTKLTAGVTLPLVGAGLAAINWASDQQEAGNKVDQVFKGNAKEVRQWAKSNKGSILLSNAAAMDAVATYGNMLTSMGFTTEAAAELSEGWVELAQDFSSFNNIPVEQGLNAIRAAVVGEYEPLRTLGVVLDDATVKAKAMEMGLWDGTGALDAQSRALAVNALVMEQTSNVQGDAARTADGFANRVRILKADLQDLGAEIGMRLLPYAERLVGWLIDMVERFGNLSPRMQTAILAIAGVAAALGPLLVVIGMMLPALGALATAFGLLLSPIGLVVLAIGALIALGIYAWINDLWGVRDAVSAVGETLRTFADYLRFAWEEGDYFNDFLADLPGWLQPIAGLIGVVVAAYADLYDAFQALREGNFAEFADELWEAWTTFANGIGDVLARVTQNVIDWATGVDWYGLLNQVGSALFEGLQAGIDRAWPVVQAWFEGLPGRITAALSAASDFSLTLLQKGRDLITGLLDGIGESWQFVQTWATTLGPMILSQISDLTMTLLQKGSDLLQGLLDGLAAKWPAVQAWLALTGLAAFNAVGDVIRSLWQKGMDLLQGALDGLNDKWETVQAWLSLVGSNAFNAVGDVARTLRDKGLDLLAGLYDGVLDKWASVKSWLTGVGGYSSSSVGDLSGILTGAGAALMQGLWDGAKGVWDSMAGWLAEKKAEIAELKGPEREDAKVLIDNGRAIMQGLGVGLAEGWGGIENQLAGYTAGLDGMMGAGLTGSASTSNTPSIVVIQTLQPEYWKRALEDIDDAVTFARNFGSEMGLYSGMP